MKLTREQLGKMMDADKTFGVLDFIGFDGEKMDNKDSSKVENYRYGVGSEEHGGALVVYLPASVAKKTFAYDTQVKLVNPTVQVFATASYNDSEVITTIFADDMVPANQNTAPVTPKSDKKE
ncbi:DUF961 family protein [Paenilisteria weihenstephanensis]|nr:DUF961 family protein [Listeria weihenstephanensis]